MRVIFKIIDMNDNIYGTYSNSNLEDIKKYAQELADEYKKDMFIERFAVEVMECITPN